MIEKIQTNYERLKDYPFEIAIACKYNLGLKHRWESVEFEGVNLYIESESWNQFLEDVKAKTIYDFNKKQLTEPELDHVLRIYSDGFAEGYDSFDSMIKNDLSLLINDSKIRNSKIFQCCKIPGTFIQTGISTDGLFNMYIEEATWYKQGISAGYYYRAWLTIVKSPNEFITLFREDDYFYNIYSKYYQRLISKNSQTEEIDALKSIIDNCNYSRHVLKLEKEISDLRVKNMNPIYLIDKEKLLNVYCEFNNVVFECVDKEFLHLFDLNNNSPVKVKMLNRQAKYFYYILWILYENRDKEKVSLTIAKKTDFVKKVLIQVNGNLNSYHNNVLNKPKSKLNYTDRNFVSKVKNALHLKN